MHRLAQRIGAIDQRDVIESAPPPSSAAIRNKPASCKSRSVSGGRRRNTPPSGSAIAQFGMSALARAIMAT
jgi:hypothetical protein